MAGSSVATVRCLYVLLLRAAGLLSVETYTCCDSPPPEQHMRELLSVVDIFSPNEAEAESIVGAGTPQQLVDRLLQLGALIVALRMGEKGVLLARQQDGGQLDCCAVSASAGSHCLRLMQQKQAVESIVFVTGRNFGPLAYGSSVDR